MNPAKIYLEQSGQKAWVAAVFWSRTNKNVAVAAQLTFYKESALICADSVISAIRKMKPKQTYIAEK